MTAAGAAHAWVPLWCRSNYSFLRGASHPDELVRTAADAGRTALALTDIDSVAGAVQAHVEARAQSIARGRRMQLIVGAEVSVGSIATGDGDGSPWGVRWGRLILLAQSRRGYANLATLLSRGHARMPKGEALVSCDEVVAHGSDLVAIFTSASRDARLSTDLPGAFRGRAYVGVSRHRTERDHADERALRGVAELHGLPILAVPSVRYHEPDRRRLLDVMQCIRRGMTIDEAGMVVSPNALFALPDDALLVNLYGDEPSWLTATREVAERCSFSLDEIEYRYPSEPRPAGHDDGSWLRELTLRGGGDRYPDGVPADVARQIDAELQLIEELDYGGYFLTMYEIVRFCRENGILCQGRGSAANSIVCYCLGITAVDPVRMDLLFERFLSRERAEPPDIDLDIEHRRREEVIAFVYRRYGREHAAMVCNVVRYRRRSAVRDVGSALGVESATTDQIARLLSHRSGTVGDAAAAAGLDRASPRVVHFLELVEQILDAPRHLSIHPGGFLLGRDPIATIVPIEPATMPGRTVVQWDKYAIEEMNLFKVDLLGLGALTHIDYALALIDRYYRRPLTMATIPAGCSATYAMIRRADTVGVFQLESRAQMAMLPRLKPRTFYDIVVEISIVRPGPITGGMVHPYLRRRAGEEAVEYPHPDVEPILAKTLGIPLFQEQVMKLAVVAASYTPGEADQLRRDMAAWRRSGRIEHHRARIVARMEARGIAREFAERVFDQIRGFGEYGFPESHAASFSLIAYATAWLRCHYLDAFVCGLLNAWPMGFYSPATIVSDALRSRLEVRPIDLAVSLWECTLEPASAPEPGRHFAVRMGLGYVKGLSRDCADRIVATRHLLPPRGESLDGAAIKAFLRSAAIPEDAARALAAVGAFDGWRVERRQAVWEALGIADRSDDRAARVVDELPAIPPALAPTLTALSRFERVAWDYLAGSHSTAAHPIEPHRPWLRDHGYPSAAEVAGIADGVQTAYIGMVICRQRPETARGTVFLTLEDETGFVNLVVWERRFGELRGVLLTGSVIGVRGRVQSAESTVHLIVDEAWHPRFPEYVVGQRSRDFH